MELTTCLYDFNLLKDSDFRCYSSSCHVFGSLNSYTKTFIYITVRFLVCLFFLEFNKLSHIKTNFCERKKKSNAPLELSICHPTIEENATPGCKCTQRNPLTSQKLQEGFPDRCCCGHHARNCSAGHYRELRHRTINRVRQNDRQPPCGVIRTGCLWEFQQINLPTKKQSNIIALTIQLSSQFTDWC